MTSIIAGSTSFAKLAVVRGADAWRKELAPLGLEPAGA
jgi:hypothetical protein